MGNNPSFEDYNTNQIEEENFQYVNIECLSADDKNLYVNNDEIYTIDEITRDFGMKKSEVGFIYNLSNRRFLFELHNQYDIGTERELFIYYLSDNKIQTLGSNNIFPGFKLNNILISEHPARNNVFIIEAYIYDNRLSKTYFGLLIIKDNTIEVYDVKTMTIDKRNLLPPDPSFDIFFSSRTSLTDYIISKGYFNKQEILDTKYEGDPVKAYININKQLIITNNDKQINIHNLSDNKIVRTFNKKEYGIVENHMLQFAMIGDDAYTKVVIADAFTTGNILLLKFTSLDIIATKIDTDNYRKSYIDFYGISTYNHYRGLRYELFEDDKLLEGFYEIKGDKMAANHELYEEEVRKLIAKTEIYLPLQNIVEEYL